jgi:hypothetical protein
MSSPREPRPRKPTLSRFAYSIVAEEARREDLRHDNRNVGVPSVGYSTCHWCHLIEGESFEDEEIAHYLATKGPAR